MSWLTLNCLHRLLFSSSWAEWARAAEDSMLGGYIENLNITNITINKIFYKISFFTKYFDFLQVKNDSIKATSEPETDNKLSSLLSSDLTNYLNSVAQRIINFSASFLMLFICSVSSRLPLFSITSFSRCSRKS